MGRMAGYWIDVGWEQAHLGHRVAFGLAEALIDDWYFSNLVLGELQET